MPKHKPRAGRRAFICLHKDHSVPIRKFAGPEIAIVRCKDGHIMTLQENKPYMGQEVPSV